MLVLQLASKGMVTAMPKKGTRSKTPSSPTKYPIAKIHFKPGRPMTRV